MLIDSEILQDGSVLNADIGVVGAGPAGIVLTLELSRAGYTVALIESGYPHFLKEVEDLNHADYFDPQVHLPMSECVRRQIGGTSVAWGGRCVPYDPVDFEQRDYIPYSSWPVTYNELQGYFQKACDYFLCGNAEFNINDIPNISQKSIVPGLPDGEILTSTLERWSLPTNFAKEYIGELKSSDRIRLFYSLTCTNIELNESKSQVVAVQAKNLTGKTIYLTARKYILAGGGLNTTRLLLNCDRQIPGGIGNHSGFLGKFYMGHLSGDIAKVHFTTPPEDTIFGFDRDSDQVYLRRRFSFTQNFLQDKKLANIVAWLGPDKYDNPAHHNGILSTAYLASHLPILKNYLASTAIWKAHMGKQEQKTYPTHTHLRNILKDLGQLLTFIPSFGYRRYFSRRKIPSLLLYNATNQYLLHYHSEQCPNPKSQITLSRETDKLGMRRLNIDLRFMPEDITSIIRAHQYWDQYLRKHNCGYLSYLTDDLEASVLAQIGDGLHQIGTTRMSASPKDGVVGPNCNIHGLEDLFIASSSIFVTSSQANPTFMIVVFALRLADQLKKTLASP